MPRPVHTRFPAGSFLLTAAACLGGAAMVGATGLLDRPAISAPAAPPLDIAPEDLAAAESLSRAFAAISERISPAVVSIDAVQTVRATPRRSPRMPFFNGPDDGGSAPREFQRGGQGSGFVVRDDGFIVTNNHVIENASRIRVRFSDGRVLPAEIVGADAPSDLAVLRVDARDLVPVDFADDESLRVGQWVVAAGNPFGLGSSITAGIVSATGRGIGINRYEDFIQTDAAINPGNSGGPLLNLRGEVVGVNTAILSRTGGNVGIGFAIPADLVSPVIEQLIDGGAVRRGYLGVVMGAISVALADRLDFDGTGVIVREVTLDGPAASAGLETQDIITSVDGESVASPAELGLIIASRRPGDTIDLRVVRDERARTISVILEEFTPEMMAGRVPPPAPERPEPEAADSMAAATEPFGLDLQPMTPEIAARLDLSGVTSGLLVARVRAGSPAAKAGLTAGSVIVGAENRPLEQAEDWVVAVESADRTSGILLSVRIGEASRFVVLEFPADD